MTSTTNNYTLYTDGSCLGNPGNGGYAYLLLDSNSNKILEGSGFKKDTTNNRMELTAVINALKFFNNNTYSKCIIYSDSQYVINTINNNWKRNKNNDLWEQLDSLISSNIKFVWVKGHDGNEMNEKADKLAVCGSELFIP